MTRMDIAREVAKQANIPVSTADEALVAAFQAISSSLAKGESVYIRGFGTFETTERAARKGRLVSAGEFVSIPARVVPTFRPSPGFKDLVNK